MRQIQVCMIATVILLTMGCSKEYVEIVPVVSIRSYLLPDTGVVEHLVFLDEQTGFAARRHGNVIYRTTSGGTSWETIATPNGIIRDLCFLTHDLGFVIVGNTLYKTMNGGSEWTPEGPATVIGKTHAGLVVRGGYTISVQSMTVQVSADSGQTFQTIGTYFTPTIGVRVCLDRIVLWGNNSGIAIDPGTGASEPFGFQPEVSQGIVDVQFFNDCGTLVGKAGDIKDGCTTSYLSRKNPWHRKDMRAVDGVPGGPWFAVGVNTISTNFDIGNGHWNEVFNEQGGAIVGSFHSLAVVSASIFFVGTKDGRILKCRF